MESTLTIEDILLLILASNTPNLSEYEISEARKCIKKSIENNNIIMLRNKDDIVGFFTVTEYGSVVSINNLCIIKQFRNKNNLLHLRKVLRERFGKDKLYHWKSRKRKHNYKTH